MAAGDATCIADVMTDLKAALPAAIASAIDAIVADGGSTTILDIAETYLMNEDDLDDTKLQLPALTIWWDGASTPTEWMTSAMDERWRVGLTVTHEQVATVDGAETNSYWYARALQLAMARTWTGIAGLTADYIGAEPERLTSATGVATATRNRRRVTSYWELTLRTTRGC